MKVKEFKYLCLASLFSVFLLSGFVASSNAVYCVNRNNEKTTRAARDTVYLFNGKNINTFDFIMRNPKVNVEKLYKIRHNILIFNTHRVGYFRTKINFKHFELHTEWKWMTRDRKNNSGVLVYMQKPDIVWPECIQINLKNQHAGDFIAMNGAMFPEAKNKPKGVVPKFKKSSERPVGKWNECNIICKGDSIMVYVNGVFQNKATHINLKNGYIGFQLEGHPVEFRNIYLVKE